MWLDFCSKGHFGTSEEDRLERVSGREYQEEADAMEQNWWALGEGALGMEKRQ